MTPTDTLMSEEEYLVREPEAEYKSEFRDGRVVAMAGASLAHSRITVNLTRILGNQLQGSTCLPYSSDIRIKVPAARFYTYPDLSVVCGNPEVDPREPGTVTNPTVLVEVLSPSTAAYDRGQKFAYYKRLDSLREYVLVAQSAVRVERFVRQDDGSWVEAVLQSIEDVLALSSIGCRVALRDIYERVAFGSSA